MSSYRVRLDRLGGGASFTVIKHEAPPASSRLVLADGLTRRIGFTDDQLPSPVEPVTISLTMAARTAAELPTLETGDLWRVRLDIGPDSAGPWTRFSDDVCRLSEPEVTLRPARRWKALAALTFTDLYADLASRFPEPDQHLGSEPAYWMDEWAIRSAKNINVWYPEAWASPFNPFEMLPTVPAENAATMLERFAAGYPTGPEGRDLYALRPRYSLDPPGEQWIGAGPKPAPVEGEALPIRQPDPTQPIGYIFQFLNYEVPAGSYLPFTLHNTPDGVTVSTDNHDPATSTGVAVLPARAVTIPTTARRARDTTPNTHVVAGYALTISAESGLSEVEYSDSNTELPDPSLGPDDQRRTRSINTLNVFRVSDATSPEAGNAATRARIAALDRAYRPDLGPVLAEWSYDELTVSTAALTTDEFTRLVPMLTVAAPEEAAADRLPVRPVAVVNVGDDLDLNRRGTVTGVITRSELTIEHGELTFKLRLRPGTLPLAEGAGLTAADLAPESARWHGLTVADLAPDLTALDLRLVRA